MDHTSLVDSAGCISHFTAASGVYCSQNCYCVYNRKINVLIYTVRPLSEAHLVEYDLFTQAKAVESWESRDVRRGNISAALLESENKHKLKQ